MFPLIGAGIATLARGAVGRFAKKAAGKVLRAATGGRLLGAGGGAAAARRLIGAGAGIAGTTAVTTAVTRAVSGRRAAATPIEVEMGGEGGGGRRYRRMNPLNARALRRAIRRLDGAEKTFKKVFRFNHGAAATNVRPKARRGR